MHFAFGVPSGGEWLIILIVALLIFGSRLPKVMRSLGQSVNEFKRGVNEVLEEEEDDDEDSEKKKEKTIA